MAAMPDPTLLRVTLRPLASLALIALIALVAACGTSQVTPTGSASGVVAPGSPGASAEGPSSSADSGSPAPGASDGAATPPASGDAGSPPPIGDPQDDESCLAVIPRADVEAALGTSIGDVVAVGTDPAVSLACTYTVGDGTFLVTTTAGDPATGFQSSLGLANDYGQNPVTIDGLGDQAFYAISADRWPEQVVFVKGPVLVRLVNQTDATIGEVPFAALAATAAEAIRAEVPPVP